MTIGEACTRNVCPNDCSGNDICLSAKRLATDTGDTNMLGFLSPDALIALFKNVPLTMIQCMDVVVVNVTTLLEMMQIISVLT